MADVLDKCHNLIFHAVRELRESGNYFYFREIQSPQDAEVIVGGRRVIMVGSNNYLGLTCHPRVKEATIKAVEKYGTGCAGSRFLNGNLEIHEEFERKLARFFKKQAALIFATGYQTNVGTISSLLGRRDAAILDQYDHASILDGCRLSFGHVKKYRHNDMKDLHRVLEATKEYGQLIVVDGVFSMEGDIADLPSIAKLAKAYGARIMVDDAHGIGVLGKTGRGTTQHFGLEDQVDLVMGTYSKSLAAVGGFIVGDQTTIDYVKHTARALMFSASLPPASVAAASAALDVMDEDPGLLEQLWKNTRKMLSGYRALGFDTGKSETPIIPVVIKDPVKTYRMCSLLFEEGVFVNPIVSPAVPPGRELLRTSFMATHTDAQLDQVLSAFEKVGKQLDII
jgi:8-amino-7-oxononanoate synthase